MKTAKHTAQQGDVTLRKLASIPEGKAEIVSRKRLVLAEGEQSGHYHLIEDDDAELIRIGERILLKLKKSATIKHQEHLPIRLSPGIWEVGRVREYDPFLDMTRQVMD